MRNRDCTHDSSGDLQFQRRMGYPPYLLITRGSTYGPQNHLLSAPNPMFKRAEIRPNIAPPEIRIPRPIIHPAVIRVP